MIKTLIDLLLISLIVVFIVDISGAVDSLKRGIKYIITKGRFTDSNYRLKPLDCSLCMTFWCGLLYIILTHQFSIVNVAVVCMFSFSAETIKDSILVAKDIFTRILQIIEKVIE